MQRECLSKPMYATDLTLRQSSCHFDVIYSKELGVTEGSAARPEAQHKFHSMTRTFPTNML
jgi:hypothetical protein